MWWREATSATTPPYGLCTSSCEDTMLARISVPRSTAAAVSSHEVSTPRMTKGSAREDVTRWSLLFRQAREGAERSEVRRRGLQAALVGGARVGAVSQVFVDRPLQTSSF